MCFVVSVKKLLNQTKNIKKMAQQKTARFHTIK